VVSGYHDLIKRCNLALVIWRHLAPLTGILCVSFDAILYNLMPLTGIWCHVEVSCVTVAQETGDWPHFCRERWQRKMAEKDCREILQRNIAEKDVTGKTGHRKEGGEYRSLAVQIFGVMGVS